MEFLARRLKIHRLDSTCVDNLHLGLIAWRMGSQDLDTWLVTHPHLTIFNPKDPDPFLEQD